MLIYYLLIVLFYFCLSYDIIPIMNFKPKNIILSSPKDFTILSYLHIGSPNSINYIHRLRRHYLCLYKRYHFVYMYENQSNIKQNEEGQFINYNLFKNLEKDDDIFEFQDSHSSNKTYYFVLHNDNLENNCHNITIELYSTETSVKITNMVQKQMHFETTLKNLVYKFKIPSKHEKYVHFEYIDFDRDNHIRLTIYDNEDTIVYQNTNISLESYFELKNNCSYNIQLNIDPINTTYTKETTYIYFYFVQSNYFKYIPVEINTEYYLAYHIYKPTYLLLNLSTIKEGNYFIIEFDKSWDKSKYFSIYGYETENDNIIENTPGNELELVKVEDCDIYNYKCENYIHKDSDKMKLAIFKIGYNSNIFYRSFLNIKYGRQEKYFPTTVYISFGIGIALSIPNAVIEIIGYKKKWPIPSVTILYLDILWHIGCANILSPFLYLGAGGSFWIGVISLGLYGLMFFLQFAFIPIDYPTIFNGLFGLFKRCKKMRCFEEAFNERRKLPPQIIIGAKTTPNDNYYTSGINDICNEISNERIEIEYEYCSWEDNTDFILNKESPVLECQFSLEVNLDKETENDLDKFKKDIKGTNISETVLCPGFKSYEVCVLKPQKLYEKFLPIIWFISYFTGYLSIFDKFIHYDVGKVDIRIKKLISNTNAYKAAYKKNDENLENYRTPGGQDETTSYYTIELKNQPLLG